MKNLIYIAHLSLILVACKKEKTKTVENNPLTISEKIANAHGIKNWQNISEINFTFNVDRDSSHFERTWIWKPKTNDVTFITENDTIRYNRTKLDATNTKTDQSFINDKFWLLIPFQLVWDSGTYISEPIIEEAPISKIKMNKITLRYPDEGGYTPGDAYDIYFKDDYIIKEWIFRKGNTPEPSMITTFENHQDYNGIILALTHRKADSNWKLYFSNIIVK